MCTFDAALPRLSYSLSVAHWGACSRLATSVCFLVALGSSLSSSSAHHRLCPVSLRSLPPRRQLGPPSLAVASFMPVFALRLHLPYTPCMPVPALRPPLPCHAVPPSSVHARVQLASAPLHCLHCSRCALPSVSYLHYLCITRRARPVAFRP